MEKYRNKYRVKSTRLTNWDYGWQAYYFVTICTCDKAHFFGEINNNEMYLHDIGLIAEQEWLKTFEMRPDMNLEMCEYVVMPNHFHAIIGIGANRYNTCNNVCGGACGGASCTSTSCKHGNGKPKNKFGAQSKNLASVIRGFKIGVTRNARLIQQDFSWQSRFYEHIIRNKDSYNRISDYIRNNPSNWKKDRFNE